MLLFDGTWPDFVSASAVYFAILDPFFCLAIFSAATAEIAPPHKAKQALVATGVALGVLVAFAAGGTALLGLFSLSLTGIRLGGGVVLLVLGIQTVLQKAFGDIGEPGRSSPGVLIGSPVLAGPGAIVHTLMLREKHGLLFPIASMSVVLLLCGLAMLAASWISRRIDVHWVELFSRIMGLLLVAYAAEMILATIAEYVRTGGPTGVPL
jgi:multiple antibiotic resistance protein